MKRIFSMFLALMLFFSMTVTASAENFQISTNKNVIEAGEKVTVTVKLGDALTGSYRNVQGQLKYDTDVLTYKSHEMGEKYEHYSSKYMPGKKYFTFSYTDMTSGGFSQLSKGTIVSVVFKTKKDITEKNLSSKLTLNMSVQNTKGKTNKTKADTSIVICKEHTWKQSIEKATMTEDGIKSNYCSVCNKAGEEVVIPKAATVELSSDTYTYSGKVISPTVIVKDIKGNAIGSENYTVTTPDGRKNAGNYTYVVTFKNDYEGTKKLILTIEPAKLTSAGLSYTAYTYNGKVKTPAVTAKAGTLTAASKRTTDSTNVDLTYAKGRKNVGTYKVTVKGRGNYTGTVTKIFKINPKGTSVSKLTKGKKSFTVKWKKQSSKMATSRITGYQYRYSTSSKMTSAKIKTVKGYGKTSAKKTGLKAKKKYYVQVRTYKKVSGTTYYSAWSRAKSVKTK